MVKKGLVKSVRVNNYVFVLILSLWGSLYPISMVYNFRIAQITKQPIVENGKKSSLTTVALFFDQYRKKHMGIRQNFAGGLGSLIYDYKPYYCRVDAAFSHIHETVKQETSFSGTETDDILFTVGRNVLSDEHNVVTLSGLFGIPTHRILRLEHVDFGYSQVGLGVQLDGLYKINTINTLVYGGRYIYFIPRYAHNTLNQTFMFTLGNIGDLLIANKNNWNEHHGIEVGYTMRIRFGAQINPSLDFITQKADYLRSNFYGVYKYRFKINEIPNRCMLNFSYSYDHSPKLFGNKYIITVWASWNTSF